MLTLKNISRRMVVCNLVGAKFEEREDAHGYSTIRVIVVDHDTRTGAVYPRYLPKRVCSSIRFAAGELRGDLPNALLDCPEVAGAIARGELRIMAQTEDTPAEPEKPATPPKSSAPPSADKKARADRPTKPKLEEEENRP